MTELVINESAISETLKAALTVSTDDDFITIPLVNTDNRWFSGNFLGYSVSCNGNGSACKDINVTNLVDNNPVDWTMVYNETSDKKIMNIA